MIEVVEEEEAWRLVSGRDLSGAEVAVAVAGRQAGGGGGGGCGVQWMVQGLKQLARGRGGGGGGNGDY